MHSKLINIHEAYQKQPIIKLTNMNSKEKNKHKNQKDKKKAIGPIASFSKNQLKQSIDVLFWRQINQEYFNITGDKMAFEINKTINLLCHHNLKDDYIYSKIGFPKSLELLVKKGFDSLPINYNQSLITKLFGLCVYIQTNNLGNNENDTKSSMIRFDNNMIKEEMKLLESKLEDIEQTNMNNIMKIKETANRIEQSDQNVNDIKQYYIDYNNSNSKLQRYDNLIIQICSLQMKEFSESICGVKRDKKTNQYIIKFDPSENIESLTLNQDEYVRLIKHRDQFNSISVYDLLLEKISSYYNSNTSSNTQLSSNKEDIQIGKHVKIHYNYCHNCKQRKPAEVMLQCKNHQQNQNHIPRPYKTYYINSTTVIRSKNKLAIILPIIGNKSLVIRYFEGDPIEYIDNIEYYDEVKECRRYFCHFCLKGSYDIIIDYAKHKTDWLCPYCSGICFCSRCTRNDKILKLIGLYVSLDGDLNVLYDSLITDNIVLDKLNANMVLSNIIVLINDPVLHPEVAINNILKKEVKDLEKIDQALAKCEDYRSNLTDIKEYFKKLFLQARIDKSLLYYDKVTGFASASSSVEEDDQESSASSFLLKKTNRSKKNYNNFNIKSDNISLGVNLQKEILKEIPLNGVFKPRILESFKEFSRKRGRPRKDSQ